MLKTKIFQLIIIALQIIYLVAIWLPNLASASTFLPYLRSSTDLQARLRIKCDLYIDAAKYYACSKIAKTSPPKIWDLNTQEQWFRNYLQIKEPENLYKTKRLSPAQYTPQAIIMFTPFSWLEMHQAIILFEIFSCVCLILPVSILLRRHAHLITWQIVYWWLIVLASAPAAENFFLGQVNGILCGLTVVFLLNWQKKNNLLAAIALALSIAIKPHRVLVLIIMSLAAKKFRLLASALFLSIFFFLIALMILGPESVFNYPKALLSIELALDNHLLPAPTTLVVGILGPISIICGPHIARLLSLPLTIFTAIVIFLIWRKALSAGPHTFPYAYASSVLSNLIFGPHEHFYDLLFLSVVWAITIPPAAIGKPWSIRPTGERLWSFTFLFFPALSWLVYFSFSQMDSGYFGAWHLPLLIFMFTLALYNFRQSLNCNIQPSKVHSGT